LEEKEFTQYLLKVPEDIHTRWKMASALQGTKMNDFGIKCIEVEANKVLMAGKEKFNEEPQGNVG
jgi:hypothetical protein